MCRYNIEPRKETPFKPELTQIRPRLLRCDLFTNVPIVTTLQANSAMLHVVYHMFWDIRHIAENIIISVGQIIGICKYELDLLLFEVYLLAGNKMCFQCVFYLRLWTFRFLEYLHCYNFTVEVSVNAVPRNHPVWPNGRKMVKMDIGEEIFGYNRSFIRKHTHSKLSSHKVCYMAVNSIIYLTY